MRKAYIPILFASLILWAGVAAADHEAATLGADGTTYLLKRAAFDDLFPESEDVVGNHVVLALEVRHPSREVERFLVPGTDGARQEGVQHLVYEDVSGTLYVFWDGWTGSHPMLKLASFRDGLWSPAMDVSTDPWSLKGSPQVIITRDTIEIEGESSPRQVQRTLLHVVWWEESADGDRAFYRPLVILNGVHQEPRHTYALNDFLTDEETLTLSSNVAGLVRQPAFVSGLDPHSGVIAFVDATTGHLMTLDLQVVPGDLGAIADVIRAHIIETGHRMEPRELGDVIRAHIIETGHRMNPRDLGFLAEVIRAHIIETGHRLNPRELADIIRAHIIETGVSLARERHLSSSSVPSASETTHWIELVTPADEESGRPELPHVVSLSPVLTLPAPEVGDGETWVYPSRDGRQVIVAWQEDDSLHYREGSTDREDWSSVRSLPLTSDFSLETGLQLLKDRVNP